MSQHPEAAIVNGHFTWKSPRKADGEDKAYSAAGELSSINFHIEAVSSFHFPFIRAGLINTSRTKILPYFPTALCIYYNTLFQRIIIMINDNSKDN